MSSNLLALLRTEERQLLVELRATPIFQKLEAVRRVIGLYSGSGAEDEPPTEELLLDRLEPSGATATREPGLPLRNGATTANAEGARAAAASAPFLAESEPEKVATAAPAGTLPPHPTPTTVAVAPPPAVPAPANASGGMPGLSRLAIAEPSGEQTFRDGSKAVSAVRAALLAVTR